MNYIYTFAATSLIFFIINILIIVLWYIMRKRNKSRKFLPHRMYGTVVRRVENRERETFWYIYLLTLCQPITFLPTYLKHGFNPKCEQSDDPPIQRK